MCFFVCPRTRAGPACLSLRELERRDDEGREHGDSGDDCENNTTRSRAPAGLADRRAQWALLLEPDVAEVVLVHVQLAVEAEVLGVRAEKPLDVGLCGQEVELLVLERTQVLAPDLGRILDLGELEALAQPRLTQAVPDLEHGPRF